MKAPAIPLLVIVGLAGCAQDQPTQVTGVVIVDGKVVEPNDRQRCTVVFYPDGGGPLATGVADATGRYTLSTGSASEIAAGSYRVGVRLMEATGGINAEGMPEWRAVSPAKYATPQSSGLTCQVKAGLNRFDVALSSDAGSFDYDALSIDDSRVDESADEDTTGDGSIDDDLVNESQSQRDHRDVDSREVDKAERAGKSTEAADGDQREQRRANRS